MRRTVKIKLSLNQNQQKLLQETIKQFKQACQRVVDYGWNRNGLKTYQKNKLHKATYSEIREKTDLPANLVIRARDRASETIKACVKKIKNGEKASKPTFKSDSIVYDKRTLTVWLEEERCSIATTNGRIKADFVLPNEYNDYYDKYLNNGWKITQSTIEKHSYEDDEPFYLHLGLEKEIQKNQSVNPTIMGIDLGIENLAVTSTGRFYSGTELFSRRERYEEVRGKLQAKGTRSAHLTIKQMSGRENRFACDTLHRISKKIVEEAISKDVDVIAMEELEKIRQKISNNKKFQTWAFKKLQEYIEYKANERGIEVKFVDPKYTSQRCSRCGTTLKQNRINQHFECKDCGYRVDSDYNAAKNIGFKTILDGQMSQSRMGNGQLALKSGVLKPNGNYYSYPN
ncbi:MAG: IS605 OrfB-like transposable element containing RNAse H-like and Zn finger domain [Candidatus Methanohalarchaeum thermophilum]|uniref:IS605 OrfB-like transposable element containing RNAse H-like and Zn finger domain n=1 Tax=Methanohalarchaeum thermophilum TaxID=1903181 RepID=A0A1Q6DST4_METT1|nr:MAG: IS605 OrfB-like transposable element containing RNAse H-like and Zn finger domain [Candidatus Methanohalarchaeum thermophilum]